ncbi:hypothetical protein RN001_010593 [Aquatica leii]|uniref:Arrestin C-terminal-like domain-containing protein n=1 Tax=Aquatica leii TaxID=1421715 RepID=A0AAN7SEJ1_9COLE|nr:hypothetical protein RN001_010593 [Aquatica leii]
MTDEIYIRLDNYNDYFCPGDTIRGRVECNFSTEKEIRVIQVKFKGVCCTSWIETEKYYDDFFKEERTKEITYSGEEIYFYERYNLSGPGQLRVAPGQYYYPFRYTLPRELPTSYEGNFTTAKASITYIVKAKINCPGTGDTKAVREIVVMSPLNLNLMPEIKKPIEISIDKEVCSCWCNGNNSVSFTFTLPSTGYIVGQDVRIGAYVQNMTNINVDGIRFKISQITERNKEIIVDCTERGVGAHGEKSWTSILPLPANNPCHNLVSCSLINVTYRLKAELFLPCPHTNLVSSLPLIIGHVPFTDFDRNNFLLGPLNGRDLNRMPNFNTNLDSRVYSFPDMQLEEQAPPTYEEAKSLFRQS